MNLLREVLSTHQLQNPVTLGGDTDIVEIDESKFGHKRKYSKGRTPKRNAPWVFGLVERQAPKRCALFTVTRRTKAQLLPKIRQYVRPGSQINSDDWKVYHAINRMGLRYTHKIVCHKDTFVAEDGTHTNCIEGLWSVVKRKLKFMYGWGCASDKIIGGHLDEATYRWNNRGENIYENLLQLIAAQYPVNPVIQNARGMPPVLP